jgi:hypothetical protein
MGQQFIWNFRKKTFDLLKNLDDDTAVEYLPQCPGSKDFYLKFRKEKTPAGALKEVYFLIFGE